MKNILTAAALTLGACHNDAPQLPQEPQDQINAREPAFDPTEPNADHEGADSPAIILRRAQEFRSVYAMNLQRYCEQNINNSPIGQASDGDFVIPDNRIETTLEETNMGIERINAEFGCEITEAQRQQAEDNAQDHVAAMTDEL